MFSRKTLYATHRHALEGLHLVNPWDIFPDREIVIIRICPRSNALRAVLFVHVGNPTMLDEHGHNPQVSLYSRKGNDVPSVPFDEFFGLDGGHSLCQHLTTEV